MEDKRGAFRFSFPLGRFALVHGLFFCNFVRHPFGGKAGILTDLQRNYVEDVTKRILSKFVNFRSNGPRRSTI